MARKVSRKGFERVLQSLLRDIVILRDKGCVTCPIWQKIISGYRTSPTLQAGHYFSRGAKSVKYDLRNVACQCQHCNSLHRYRKEAFTIYLIDKLCKEGFEQLSIDAHKPVPQSTAIYKLELLR